MRFYIRLAVAFLIFVAVFALLVPRARPIRWVRGHVLSGNEPIEGATVRFQGFGLFSAISKSDGEFELPVLSRDRQRITASKEGFIIGSAPADVDALIVQLMRLP